MERRHVIINKQEEYSLNIGRAYVEYAPEPSYTLVVATWHGLHPCTIKAIPVPTT